MKKKLIGDFSSTHGDFPWLLRAAGRKAKQNTGATGSEGQNEIVENGEVNEGEGN